MKAIKANNLHAILTSDRVYLAFKKKGQPWQALWLDFSRKRRGWAPRAELKGIKGADWVQTKAVKSPPHRRRRYKMQVDEKGDEIVAI